ncbi:MAG: hypothetical protein JWN48_1143 [Myxococcaceae bacterium]|nr:hypothetical protein [Myxococcaceae bacterium]
MTSIRLTALMLLGTCTACGSGDPEEGELAAPALYLKDAADTSTCGFTEIISPSELNTTERTGFTSDGRMIMIGTRPSTSGDDPSVITELVKDGQTKRYRVSDLVQGALGGTSNGQLGGSPLGDPCMFTGMAVQSSLIYAGCLASDGRASFVQVDLERGTVRADILSTCNLEPPSQPCNSSSIMPNGMAIDEQGRIYVSNMLVHLSLQPFAATPTLTQIVVEDHPAEPSKLRFRHRTWLDSNAFADGPSPNGVQIRGDTLYYAAGPNLNAVPIERDGSAGTLRVFYRGPALSYIDDFGEQGGTFLLARTLLPGVVATLRPRKDGLTLRETASCALPHDAVPSSISYQPALAPESMLFASGTVVVTSYYGGGLYTLPKAP